MRGRRKSCKTCKKTAASGLPFAGLPAVPVVDGVFISNNHQEPAEEAAKPRTPPAEEVAAAKPRTPGFRSSATAATAYATPQEGLGRTYYSTPGFRKSKANSFTAVAQQTAQEIPAAGKKNVDNDDITGKKKKNSSCGEKQDPQSEAGCSGEHAANAKVSVAPQSAGATNLPTNQVQTTRHTDASGVSHPSDESKIPEWDFLKSETLQQLWKKLESFFLGRLEPFQFNDTSKKYNEKIVKESLCDLKYYFDTNKGMPAAVPLEQLVQIKQPSGLIDKSASPHGKTKDVLPLEVLSKGSKDFKRMSLQQFERFDEYVERLYKYVIEKHFLGCLMNEETGGENQKMNEGTGGETQKTNEGTGGENQKMNEGIGGENQKYSVTNISSCFSKCFDMDICEEGPCSVLTINPESKQFLRLTQGTMHTSAEVMEYFLYAHENGLEKRV